MSTWAYTPRSLPRALFFALPLALLLVSVFSVPAFAADFIVNDDPGCNDAGPTYCHIQPAIDAAASGDIIKVYPGSYNETAAGRIIYSNTGPYQFGLFINKSLTIQGVDTLGVPITDAAAALAQITTNATNNFGPSSVWVEGNNVTLTGLVFGANTGGENKTFEVLGDSFTLKYSRIAVAGGGSVYLNDERFDAANNESHIKSYTIEGNWFEQGATVDITNGAGYSGPANTRLIRNNKFTANAPGARTAISFNGSNTGVTWFVHSVGGAVITGNEFSGGEQYIRARGTYNNSEFDWASYWNNNTFDRKVVMLANPTTFDVRAYSYLSGSYTFNNVRRIGALIQPEVATAQPGDTVLLGKGLYVENVTVDKHVKLIGAGSGSDPASNTVLRMAPTAVTMMPVVMITGSGVSDVDPLMLKDLRVETQGKPGLNLGNLVLAVAETMSFIRFENVQVVGSLNSDYTENERCLNLDLNKSVSHLTVVNSGFSQCDHGWYFTKFNGGNFSPNLAQFITVNNSSFVDNSYKGIYVEMLSDASFEDVVVTGNGLITNWNAPWNAGIDINLKGDTVGQTRTYQNLLFHNLVMTGNGLGAQHGAALMIKARDDGTSYGARPASLNNVVIDGGLFTANERGIRIGEPNKNNAGPFNVQIHNAHIYGNNPAYVGSGASAVGGLVNDSRAAVNAENNWWGSNSGPTHIGNPGGTGELVSNTSTGFIDYDPWLGQAPLAALYIPNTTVDLATGATSFTLPVNLNPAAGSFSSTAFSLDYDTACLQINPADANNDGIPEAISGMPIGFVNSVKLDTADVDGELDIAIWDVTPPLASLPAGAIVNIKFDIIGSCVGPDDEFTYVKFSSAPTATFSDANGQAVYRATQGADPLKLDYNQLPTAIGLSTSSVEENKPAGTVVGTLGITDPDGDAPVYTLVNGCSLAANDNNKFTIDGATLKTADVFDYEAGASKTVCVQANDKQGGVFAQALTVSVTNINEPPTGIELSKNTVFEGQPAGTVVGTFSTQGDPDNSATHTYSPATGDGSADNGKFTFDSNGTLKTNAVFDYSVQPVFYIRVRSTDNGLPAQYVEKQFVIEVLDHSQFSIAENIVIKHGETVGVPVTFAGNGNTPTAGSFKLSYNTACLTYVNMSGGTGSASGGVVTVSSISSFAGNPVVKLNFTGNSSCQSTTSVPLTFSDPTLSDSSGPLPVSTENGSMLVIANSARGDCNADGFVNAGDFSAIVLETFDVDEPWWLFAPQSTFHGSPIGCDANASEYIDVADVVCTVLVVFGNSACTGGSMLAASGAEAATLAVAPAVDGQAVSVPVTLDDKGATVAGAAFTLVYDPAQAAFDESDADGDGLPDAVVFATTSALKRSVSVDAANGRIKIAVYGLSLPLPALDDGLIATVRLQAVGEQPLAGLTLADAALGNDSGSNTPVEVEVAGVSATRWLFLPAISN